MTAIATSPKTRALCVATRCTTVDQFVATFHRFCGEDQSFFVATMTSRPVGLETAFAIQLADKQPVLRGLEDFGTQFVLLGRKCCGDPRLPGHLVQRSDNLRIREIQTRLGRLWAGLVGKILHKLGQIVLHLLLHDLAGAAVSKVEL